MVLATILSIVIIEVTENDGCVAGSMVIQRHLPDCVSLRLSLKLLGALELSGYFSAVVGADTMGIAKPDPAPYREAVRRAGATIPRSLMVGDSGTDILLARAVGVPVIAVSFGYSDRPVAEFSPDHLVDHFDDIWPLLRAGLARAPEAAMAAGLQTA